MQLYYVYTTYELLIAIRHEYQKLWAHEGGWVARRLWGVFHIRHWRYILLICNYSIKIHCLSILLKKTYPMYQLVFQFPFRDLIWYLLFLKESDVIYEWLLIYYLLTAWPNPPPLPMLHTRLELPSPFEKCSCKSRFFSCTHCRNILLLF